MTFLLLGILLCVVQTTVLQMMPGLLSRIDLVYILVVFSAYRLPWVPGILVAFAVGWVLDVLAGVHLGFYPLEFLFVLVSLKLLTVNSPVKESAYQIPMVGISYMVVQMMIYLFTSMTFQYGLPVWSWVSVVQETILLVLAAIPCFLVFNGLYEYLTTRAARSRSTRRRVRKTL
ncbi:MAG: hypothetical protein ACK5PS_07485 [Desulfopila sp.]